LCVLYLLFFVCSVFFFSSRRRHTRCYRDWSSDVCSSDLVSRPCWFRKPARARNRSSCSSMASLERRSRSVSPSGTTGSAASALKIGRASCREREEMWAGACTDERKDEEKCTESRDRDTAS